MGLLESLWLREKASEISGSNSGRMSAPLWLPFSKPFRNRGFSFQALGFPFPKPGVLRLQKDSIE